MRIDLQETERIRRDCASYEIPGPHLRVVADAPQEVLSAMSGRIGRLPGVTAKTAYSNLMYD